MVNYYKTLNVSKSATETEIKNAYKKLALQWHPDKNPDNLEEANKRFVEISEAYEVLSDERKRLAYDQYGKKGLHSRNDRHHRTEQYESDDPDTGFMFSSPDELFSSPHYVFRSPHEVFREFFGNNYSDLFLRPFMGLMDDFPHASSSNGFSSISTYSNVGGATKETSTSTTFCNGKEITTKRTYENGRETVKTYENGILKSKTVNGATQALSYY